jgi:tetratricopeptide (TPR) repeat protein
MYRGMMEMELGNCDKASSLLEESLKIIEEQLGDPLMIGQVKRQQGRLAFRQKNYTGAESFYQNSLETLEPLRAYLEMCYTKFYWAELILQKLAEALIDPLNRQDEIEKGQRFLMQASFTFDACAATPAFEKANELLRKFDQPSLV